MEKIALGTTGRTTTRLGFGCSSLMGAMDRKESVAMLEAAFDAGIRHFDVAPMYGFGQAESCLGDFLARHRVEVTVTTKFGIPPAKHQGLIGVARTLVRPIVRALPGVKHRLLNVAAKAAATPERPGFTAAEARQSLERSLTQLRTDHIDVWLLHEVTADDLREDMHGLLRLLEDAVAAGKIGAFGAGSDREKVRTLAIKRPQFCGTMQFEWSVMDALVPELPGFRIHHRALTENFRAMHAGLTEKRVRCAQWSESVGANLADRDVLAALMLKAALVENPASVILFSSKNAAHVRRNVEVAGDETLEAPAKELYRLVQEAAKGHRMIEAGE